ncbi:MAG: hypothetical protein JXA28_12295 [Bacteroidetes bacterium]|nr:hypothetical protein [Bacteroidota bacterium]
MAAAGNNPLPGIRLNREGVIASFRNMYLHPPIDMILIMKEPAQLRNLLTVVGMEQSQVRMDCIDTGKSMPRASPLPGRRRQWIGREEEK